MKTFKDSLIDGNGNIITTYTDELGQKSSFPILESSLTTDELSAFNAWKTVISNRINDTSVVPKVLDNVSSVSLVNGKFTITGEFILPKDFSYSDLSNVTLVDGTSGKTQKQIYDELAAFVLSATGSSLTSMYAPFNTGFVIINTNRYTYSTISAASGSIMTNATKLAKYLLNS